MFTLQEQQFAEKYVPDPARCVGEKAFDAELQALLERLLELITDDVDPALIGQSQVRKRVFVRGHSALSAPGAGVWLRKTTVPVSN